MPRRRGVMLIVIVPLAFAAVSSAGVPSFSITKGRVTSLTPTELTVQANAQVPTSCTRASSSPAVAGFNVGDQVTINCIQGVLVGIAAGLGKAQLGPVIPIPGLAENGGVPSPGPHPTTARCVSAWNTNAPLAARQAMGAQSPIAAMVTASRDSLLAPPPSTGGFSHVVASGPICAIWFALPGLRTAEVQGFWKDGTAREWQGFIEHGGPQTTGILSLAVVKALVAATMRDAMIIGKKPTPSNWYSVSANGTLSSAA